MSDTKANEWRTDTAIADAWQEYWDKVWWNRHMQIGQPEPGRQAAARIEAKYGIHNLPLSGFEYGVACGRLSALAWVMGAGWDESMDT